MHTFTPHMLLPISRLADANSEATFASHREKAQAQALLRRSDARATTLNSTEERSQVSGV